MKRNVSFRACYLPILAKFVGQGDPRAYLNYAHVEPAPAGQSGVLLVASDGHRLVVIHDEKGSTNGKWLVHLPERILKLTKKLNPHRGDLVRYGHARARIVAHEGIDLSEPSAVADGDQRYADWRTVVKTALKQDIGGEQRTDRFAANVEYLADLRVLFDALHAFPDHGSRFEFRGEHRPLIVHPGHMGHKIVALVMPCRIRECDEERVQAEDAWLESVMAAPKAVEPAPEPVSACGELDDGA